MTILSVANTPLLGDSYAASSFRKKDLVEHVAQARR